MREYAVFVCRHVFDVIRPILLIAHEEDGDWQFLCGDSHGHDEEPLVVGLNHLTDRDARLAEVLHMDRGWEAERVHVDAAWEVRRIED